MIDFGFACKVKDAYASKLPFACGTPIYMCPEMAQKKEHIAAMGDIWALGVILFILITGKMPFYGGYEADLYRMIIAGKYNYPAYLQDKNGHQVEIAQGGKNLVKRILQVDPKNRPTAATLLKDPWLKGGAPK